MALSNILREPRRELIESGIGIGVVLLFGLTDVGFAFWFRDAFPATWEYMFGDPRLPFWTSLVAGILIALVIWAVVIATHAIGNKFCDWLEKSDIHLRPINRRRRW